MSHSASHIQFSILPGRKIQLWKIRACPYISVVCNSHQGADRTVPFDLYSDRLILAFHHDTQHQRSGHQSAQRCCTDRCRFMDIRTFLHNRCRFAKHHPYLSVAEVDLQHFIPFCHLFHLRHSSPRVAATCHRWFSSVAAFIV